MKHECTGCRVELRACAVSASLLECPVCGARTVRPGATAVPMFASLDGGPARLVADVDLPPAFSGRFELTRLLGAGSMGAVYLAKDLPSSRLVAIKFLMIEKPTMLERFLREGRFLSRVEHPNLVRVYEVHQAGKFPYLVCEYVEGGTLRDRMNRQPRMELEAAVPIVLDCLAGLDCCHSRGLVHRDFKPENVLLDRDGRARIADLGIARDLGHQGPTLTRTGTLIGTPMYMAPELVSGENAVAATDLYALGAVFYEMLAGRPPFLARTMSELLKKQLSDPPVRLETLVPGLPEAIVEAIHRALAKPIADRPASAALLAAQLRRALAGDRPAPERAPSLQLRRLLLAVAAAAAMVAAGALWLARPRAGVPVTPDSPLPSVEPLVQTPASAPALPPEIAAIRRIEAEIEAQPMEISPWDRERTTGECPLVVSCLDHTARVRIDPKGGALRLPGGMEISQRTDLPVERTGLVDGLNWVRIVRPGDGPPTILLDQAPCRRPIASLAGPPREAVIYERVLESLRSDILDSSAARQTVRASYPDGRDVFARVAMARVDVDGDHPLAQFTDLALQRDPDPLLTDPGLLAKIRAALDLAGEGVRTDEQRWEPWQDLGSYLRRTGHFPGARRALAAALMRWPESHWTWRELGRLQRRLWLAASARGPSAHTLAEAHRVTGVTCLEFTRRFLGHVRIPYLAAEIDTEYRELARGDAGTRHR